MKKLFLTLIVALVSLTASAQVYVGGEVGLWRNTDDNFTNFTLAPEVGYHLSDKWAIGVGIGYSHDYYNPNDVDDKDYGKSNTFALNPYARWSCIKFGPVSFILDMGFGIGATKDKGADESYTVWNIGVKPGIKVSLAKNIDFIAHAGFLGYKDADDALNPNLYDKGFGFRVDATSLNFGLNFNF